VMGSRLASSKSTSACAPYESTDQGGVHRDHQGPFSPTQRTRYFPLEELVGLPAHHEASPAVRARGMRPGSGAPLPESGPTARGGGVPVAVARVHVHHPVGDRGAGVDDAVGVGGGPHDRSGGGVVGVQGHPSL
jgi:hypothetical protein